ncbi:hypothetical protein EG329_006810 [Mollisiaceae sp. DMI_Dod_QoI]|nr:hypothetical protein EG329_006810 [Helotiales sp. DMI_Dod_QoI]
MSDIARGNVEILVHTTAPSLGPDDARYRALAQAYLDFQPAKRRSIEDICTDDDSIGIDIQNHVQFHEDPQQSTMEERESEASWRPNEENTESLSQSQENSLLDRRRHSGLLESPELSFDSVMDNRMSPAFRGQITCRQTASQKSVEVSWQPPGSEVPDSQPEINPALTVFSSPTRILEVFLQNRDGSQSTSTSGPTHEGQRGSNSLEVPVSSERDSNPSLLSLLHNQNQQQSSSGVGGSSERASLSPHLSCKQNQQQTSLEMGIGSGRSSHSSPIGVPQSQNQDNSSLEVEVGNESVLLSPSDAASINSSPSPVKNPVRQPARALRSKSPNEPLIQDLQLEKKRKFLGSIPETQVSSSAPPALALNELPPTVRPLKKQRLEPASSPIQAATSRSTDSIASTPSGTVPKTIWSDRLEIHPPPPMTSKGDLTAEMLLTPKLHEVARRMPLARFFRTLEQKRDLNPMERGYWIVSCAEWEEGTRARCWNFLGELVGNGAGGWGVWCIRDTQFETIRVYCWGVVVGHIYLVLMLASETKIRKSQPCWIAGDGEIIIKIPS